MINKCSIDGCNNPHYGRGWCNKHYQRWLYHGDTNWKRKTPNERFEEKYIPVTESGCWIWTDCTRNGYGAIRIKGKMKRSHRVSWELHNGFIPKGMCVLHKCDVRSCVNPSHLFLGSRADNAKDREEKGRGNQLKGESKNNSKLIEEDIIVIRASTKTQAVIAKEYNISQALVCGIRTGKRWRHIL